MVVLLQEKGIPGATLRTVERDQKVIREASIARVAATTAESLAAEIRENTFAVVRAYWRVYSAAGDKENALKLGCLNGITGAIESYARLMQRLGIIGESNRMGLVRQVERLFSLDIQDLERVANADDPIEALRLVDVANKGGKKSW